MTGYYTILLNISSLNYGKIAKSKLDKRGRVHADRGNLKRW